MKEMIVNMILQWLNTARETFEKYNVEPQNIYNIDKSGFVIGSILSGCIIIDIWMQSHF